MKEVMQQFCNAIGLRMSSRTPVAGIRRRDLNGNTQIFDKIIRYEGIKASYHSILDQCIFCYVAC